MASPPLTIYDYAQRKNEIEAKTPRQEKGWWGLSIRALFAVGLETVPRPGDKGR
jgi:hypothetical protein